MGLLLFYFLNFRRQREAGREREQEQETRERERERERPRVPPSSKAKFDQATPSTSAQETAPRSPLEFRPFG